MGVKIELIVTNNMFVGVHDNGAREIYSAQEGGLYQEVYSFMGSNRLKSVLFDVTDGADGRKRAAGSSMYVGPKQAHVLENLEGLNTVWASIRGDQLAARGSIRARIPMQFAKGVA